MLKSLRPRRGEAGFTLIELLITVLIVGVLAAVGVPLYLGYVRDSRLAEGKAVLGSVLTAAQGCAQVFPGAEDTNCTLAKLATKAGLTAAGVTGDGKWTVSISPVVTLDTGTNKFGGGPVKIVGNANTPVTNMSAGIWIDANGRTAMHCKTDGTNVAETDADC